MFNLIWNFFCHFNLVLVANFQKIWNQNKILYWNLHWNTSQDKEDAIYKQVIAKLFVNKLKTVFLVLKIVQNSSRNIWSYQSSSSVLLETLTITFRTFTWSFSWKLSDIKGFALFQSWLLFTICFYFCCPSLCSLVFYQ